MRGAFFIWSWLSQKCCFGTEVLFARFYTMNVHMRAPALRAGSTENVAVLGGLMACTRLSRWLKGSRR